MPKLPSGQVLNASGSAGPRRLAVLGLVAAGVVGVVATVLLTGTDAPPVSRDARLGKIDPLPGGLHTTPAQDALSLTAIDTQSSRAIQKGVSYTPPMAPSQPAQPLPPPPSATFTASPVPAPAPGPVFVGRPTRPTPQFRSTTASAPPTSPQAFPAAHPAPDPDPPMHATTVAATGPEAEAQAKAQAAYKAQIDTMFAQWGGHPPRTDVVLPPPSNIEEGDGNTPGSGGYAARQRAPSPPPTPAATPVSSRSGGEAGRILVPAGRGVFAHPVLALNSDQTSPVVLQADSGPIAGDRMIGTFSKESNRLIIHISTIIHNGENIGCDGVVTAPDTMEAGVASRVDEHYIARFVLPAAAAFVQGLGAAIATTSNTTAVLSPLGGATTSTQLNLPQQLGIAAGTASQQLGTTLNQEAPKGPTISLEANVAVGVMFLSNVTSQHGGR